MLKEIYKYRELLKTNVKKDIRGRYKASVLGVLWSFINPLLQVLVYAIVFPYLMKGSADHYVVYLVTGIIPWTFFQTVVNQSTTCIKSNSGIIKKVYFPRIILPLSAFFSGLINFFISCIIIVVFCLGFGIGISWHLIFLPVIAVRPWPWNDIRRHRCLYSGHRVYSKLHPDDGHVRGTCDLRDLDLPCGLPNRCFDSDEPDDPYNGCLPRYLYGSRYTGHATNRDRLRRLPCPLHCRCSNFPEDAEGIRRAVLV